MRKYKTLTFCGNQLEVFISFLLFFEIFSACFVLNTEIINISKAQMHFSEAERYKQRV